MPGHEIFDRNGNLIRAECNRLRLGLLLPLTIVAGILLVACAGQPTPEAGDNGTPEVTSVLPSSPPTPTGTPTPRPLRKLAPPLAQLTFPRQTVPYPGDWPSALIYPPQFGLVGTSDGALPGSDSAAWAARFRFDGAPSEALEMLLAYWEEGNWQIAEQMHLSAPARAFIVVNDAIGAEGVLVMDAEGSQSDSTIISAAFLVQAISPGP